MKCDSAVWIDYKRQSPSMRREWIEMPHNQRNMLVALLSPSMRREWIEIFSPVMSFLVIDVSLHAEGVD